MSISRLYSRVFNEKLLMGLSLAFIAFMYLLFVGGCDTKTGDAVDEVEESLYSKGKAELRKGNANEALGCFLKVIEKRRDAPESHWEAGSIYLNSLNDPIAAIYHFKKYLELKPDSNISGNVKQMIETAHKRFAASLPLTPFSNNVELEEIISKLQKENYELKQRLATYADTIEKLEKYQKNIAKKSEASATLANIQQTVSEKPDTLNNSRHNTKPPEVQRDKAVDYVVKPGDTLSSISRKVYGTTSRWKDIYKANRSVLPSPEALKPGQTLKMPR